MRMVSIQGRKCFGPGPQRLRQPQWLVSLSAAILFVGCAVSPPAIDTAIGSRSLDGQLVPFSSSTDLTVSGLVDEGLTYAKKGRGFEAEARLRQALYLAPGIESIRFNLAVVLERQGQFEEAIEILTELNQTNPESIDYHLALGHAIFDSENHGAAIPYYKEAFQLARSARNASRASSIARTISSALYQLGLEQESLCYSYEAYSQKPSGDEAFNHGRMLMSLGLVDSTDRFIARAIEDDKALKSRAAVLYISGLAKYALGEKEAAFKLLDRGLDFVAKEQSLGAELSAAWYVLRIETTHNTDDLGEKEKEAFEKIRDAALEFGKSNPRAYSYWPIEMITRMDKEVADREGEDE